MKWLIIFSPLVELAITAGVAKFWAEDFKEMSLTLGNFMKRFTKAQLYENALERDIPMIPVNSPQDLLEDDQLEDRGFFIEVAHEELETSLIYPGPWAKLKGLSWPRWRVAPGLGEHNDEIYHNEIRLSEEQVATLKKTGVI